MYLNVYDWGRTLGLQQIRGRLTENKRAKKGIRD